MKLSDKYRVSFTDMVQHRADDFSRQRPIRRVGAVGEKRAAAPAKVLSSCLSLVSISFSSSSLCHVIRLPLLLKSQKLAFLLHCGRKVLIYGSPCEVYLV